MDTTEPKTLKKKNSDIAKEALSILKDTVQQIKDLNATNKKHCDSALLSMSSKDIAQSLVHKIKPSQFSNPGEQNDKP